MVGIWDRIKLKERNNWRNQDKIRLFEERNLLKISKKFIFSLDYIQKYLNLNEISVQYNILQNYKIKFIQEIY